MQSLFLFQIWFVCVFIFGAKKMVHIKQHDKVFYYNSSQYIFLVWHVLVDIVTTIKGFMALWVL